MYKLSVYEKSMPGHIGWKEKLTAAKEAGYDGVELSVDESDERLSRLDWSAAQRPVSYTHLPPRWIRRPCIVNLWAA